MSQRKSTQSTAITPHGRPVVTAMTPRRHLFPTYTLIRKGFYTAAIADLYVSYQELTGISIHLSLVRSRTRTGVISSVF